VVSLDAADPRAADAEPFLDGWTSGHVWGTNWHGAFENDGFRRVWLAEVAVRVGVRWRPTARAPSFGSLRNHMLDTLGAAIEENLNTDSLLGIIRNGPTPQLPFVPPGAP
jgi:adenosylcobyric acid synthase